MKIIAEDAFHRPALADRHVALGIRNAEEAEVMRQALQQAFGDRDCLTYRIVHDQHSLYEPN